MLLIEGRYCPPRFKLDYTESFKRRHYQKFVDDDDVDKAFQVAFEAIEAFRSRKRAVEFRRLSLSWEGYCFVRSIVEEIHSEGYGMAETIFIGGNRVAFEYLLKNPNW